MISNYSSRVEKELVKKKINAGDLLEIKKDGFVLKGILMPRPQKLGDPDCLILKLSNGYNTGIKFSKDMVIKKTPGKQKLDFFPALKIKAGKDLPNISLIASGGTIASRVDYKTGGVYMLMKPEEFLASTPELAKVANIRIKSPFIAASEDMDHTHWQKLAGLTVSELNKNNAGVIITHGTDTLGFTSAALSFMIKDLSKPVALVGAQRSSDRGSCDASMNLLSAAHYCRSDIAEVSVVMHGTTNDDYCLASRGTKVRKMHTSRRDAFRPINELPLAKVWPEGKLEIINNDFKKRTDKKVKLDDAFNPKVGIIKAYPGSNPDLLNYLVDVKNYKGIIIEAMALGHLPTQNKKNSWIPSVKKAVDKGVNVFITSSCLYGRTHPYVYSNLRIAGSAGAVYCKDMLTETAYVKLGWVLGNTRKPEKVRELMLTNIAGEFSLRRDVRSFLY